MSFQQFKESNKEESFSHENFECFSEIENSQYTGTYSTVMNLLNTIIGAGALGIPNVFSFCGFYPSFFLLILICFLCYITSIMTFQLQNKYKVQSFEAIIEKLLPPIFSKIFSISSIIFCLGALIAYILIGFKVVENSFGLINIKFQGISYKIFILIYSLLIPVALTVPRSIKFISNLSSIDIFSFLLFVF